GSRSNPRRDRRRGNRTRSAATPARPGESAAIVGQPVRLAALAIALRKTCRCSAALACPKSPGEPPYAAQVDTLNWYRPECPLEFMTWAFPPDSGAMTHASNDPGGPLYDRPEPEEAVR